MRKTLILWLVAVLTTTSASISAVRPASAADASESIDCTQAESMLETAVATRVSSAMTGDVDKDFTTLMMLHEKVGKRIDQIEAKCGKNAKLQAMAAKGADDTQQRMDEFRTLGTSQ